MSLFEPYVPEDFAEFWAEAAQEARNAPLDFHRSLTRAYDLPGFDIVEISFRSISGSTLRGWFAWPEGVRRSPAFLWTPPYGR